MRLTDTVKFIVIHIDLVMEFLYNELLFAPGPFIISSVHLYRNAVSGLMMEFVFGEKLSLYIFIMIAHGPSYYSSFIAFLLFFKPIIAK